LRRTTSSSVWGEIEHLPVADATVDVVITDCVLNLSRQAVFRGVFRVLKPSGRLAIADVVATAELPAEVRADLAAFTACIAGAASLGDVLFASIAAQRP
jgi:arsenite methyltransferase